MTAEPHAIRYESTQEPLDEEERILMDPNTWDWDTAYEIEPGPDPHLIFEVRLSGHDLEHIDQAASAKGMTINAYLRYAALECARQHAAT